MKVHELYHSQFVLVYPSGEYDLPVLTDLIGDAMADNLDDSDMIKYVVEKRVKKFSVQNPEWEQKPVTASLSYFKKKYEQLTGQEFNYENYSKKISDLNEPDKVFHALIGSFDGVVSSKKPKK